MKIHVKSAILALFLILAGVSMQTSVAVAAEMAPHFDSELLTITGKTGTANRFSIELAVDDRQREYGLMFRTEMAPDHGMLFDFGTSQHVRMWMENTVLPLDMLFLDASGKVTRIVANAVPYSRDIIDSKGQVKYVIELNGGIARKLGLAIGDKVSSPTIDRH